MKKKNIKTNNIEKKENTNVIEQDGVSLNKNVFNRMKKNKMKILSEFYTLNKTSAMIDSILATPRDLLQLDSPILAEALEDKNCQKVFKKSIQSDLKRCNKDDLIPLMYNIMSSLECSEQCIVWCISTAQQERAEFMKAIQEDNVFEMAKSIWILRAVTTAIVYFVDASKSFFKENKLLDMYKFLELAAKTYSVQVIKIENFMYNDEEEND